MKFKIGQTVEVVNKIGMVVSLGATAIVIKTNHEYYGSDLIDVVWKTNSNNQMNGGYQSYHFKPFLKEGQQLLFSFMSAMDGT